MPSNVFEPHWLTYARTLVGTKEIVGPKHSPVIMGWVRSLGAKVLGIPVNDDETPWCGTFMAYIMVKSGYKPPLIAVRALAWTGFGEKVDKPYLGAVVCFKRPSGGHVALLTGVSVDGKLYRVLGGNQSNAVNETWIEASRCVAIHWPTNAPKAIALAPVLDAKGARVSTNEA